MNYATVASGIDAPAVAWNPMGVQIGIKVWRLLPIECERLMGLPDNYTYIPYGKNGKMAKDGLRYRAIGNTIVRYVLEWLAMRIEAVEKHENT